MHICMKANCSLSESPATVASPLGCDVNDSHWVTPVLLPQEKNTKATSRCGFTRGGTQSPERQTLCTREVTGRQRKDRTGACVLTSSNPGAHLSYPQHTGGNSASGP